MFRKNKKYRIDQQQKNKILNAFYDLYNDINFYSKQVEVFKGMYSNGSISLEPGSVYAYVNDVIRVDDTETNNFFYITSPTSKVDLAGIFLNTYKSSYKGIFQIDERVKEIPIQSDIHGFFFIKLGYLTGSIFQKSTINSINPTDAENILAESYSDETGETEIYANSNEPMQIAIPIVPERGGSRKRRFRKKKSKTKKNKRI